MKKIAAILFCALYLSFSIGVVVSFHYCANNLVRVSFFKADKKSCCKTMAQAKKCCKDKTIVFKVNDNHEGAGKQLLPSKPISDIQLAVIPANNESAVLFAVEHKTFLSNSPPFYSSTPTYLLNKVFRI